MPVVGWYTRYQINKLNDHIGLRNDAVISLARLLQFERTMHRSVCMLCGCFDRLASFIKIVCLLHMD